MSKVGIVTIVKNAIDESFGPAMQIFAVQEVIRSYGMEPETIIDENCRRNVIQQLRRGLDELLNGPDAIKFIWRKAFANSPQKASNGVNDEEKKLIQLRRKRYSEYIQKYIKISELKETDLIYGNEILNEYSFFAVGSDQVWNPYYPQKDSIKYLKFCDANKRVAFVPSIARQEIPRRFRKGFREGLLGFAQLCIRESEGKDLIKKYTGRDAEILVDPTMMIPAEKYIQMEETPETIPKEPYAFCYFMGVETNTSLIEKTAHNYVKTCMWMRKFSLPEYYVMNPPEYIAAIRNAKIVLTDSFHITVFAIMLHIPVIVFPKKEGGVMATGMKW